MHRTKVTVMMMIDAKSLLPRLQFLEMALQLKKNLRDAKAVEEALGCVEIVGVVPELSVQLPSCNTRIILTWQICHSSWVVPMRAELHQEEVVVKKLLRTCRFWRLARASQMVQFT